jgi:hypothetical protein
VSDQERLRSYALGTLSGPECEELEARLLVDEELHERLELLEDALVEDYLAGALAEGDRAPFEARLARTPQLREHLGHARLLRERLTRTSPAAAHRYWPAALAALLLLAAGALLWRVRPPASTTTLPRSARATPAASPAALRPAPGHTPAQPAPMASLTLSPGQTMSEGEDARITLAPATEVLRLDLVLEDPLAPDYTAELTSESGSRVWRRAGVRADAGVMTLSVPAAGLAAGRYRLELSPPGGSPAARSLYYFEVRASAALDSR